MNEISVGSGEVDAIRPLIERAERTDGAPPISDQALLAATQGQRELLVFSAVNTGSAGAHRPPQAAGIIGQGEIDLVVDPEYRGNGLGTAALQALLEHSAAVGEAELLAWAHGVNPAADALLTRAGFTPVRTLYRMVLDPTLLPEPGAASVEAPEGFTIRPFDPAAPADAAAWVRVNARAFADHPEQGRITDADFALQRAEPWFDSNDLLLLEAPGAGDDLAGSTWIKTVPHEAGVETELYAVGVDPAYAGRGLGKVLLAATLARMAEHRPARVTLYVDGENERAVNMYRSAGFTIDSRSRQWRRVSE